MLMPIFISLYASLSIPYPSYFSPSSLLYNPPASIFVELKTKPIAYNICMNYIPPINPPLPPPIPTLCLI